MKTIRSFTPLYHGLLILALGLLAYANTFQVPFVLDDYHSIVRNPLIHDLSNYIPGGEGYEAFGRRWFGYLTFALNYHFAGLNVTAYHAVNLAIHLGAALLVYVLISLTFRTPKLRNSSLAPQAAIVALLTALIFVAHPVQTQAVTYLVQRLTSLSTLLYLLALVCYVLARLSLAEKGSASVSARVPPAGKVLWKCLLLLGAATLAAFFSMKTKEIAFTLPLMAVLYEVFFFAGAWKKRILYLTPLLLILPIIPLSIITVDGGSAAIDSATGIDEQLRAGTDMPRLSYLVTQFRVITTYLRLLVWPVNQNIDYDYPIYTDFLSLPILLSALLLLALLCIAVFLFIRTGSNAPQLTKGSANLSYDPALRLIAFGIIWFFLALAVESSFIPIEDVIFEHRLYLPSVGFSAICALMILLLSRCTATFFSGRIPFLVAITIVLSLAATSWQRNQVWGDKIGLWEDAARKSPGKARPWYNLGTYYSEEGRLQEAGNALAKALNIDVEYADAWHNLGRTYLLAGMNAEAVTSLRKAVELEPGFAKAILNLGVALIRSEQHHEAVHLLEKNLNLIEHLPEARLSLGVAYAHSGNLSAARRELTQLKAYAPDLASNLAEQIRIVESD